MSQKRSRTPPNLSPASSPETTPPAEPPSKSRRTAPSAPSASDGRPLLCTLPPTCNPPNRPTSLANSKELETHYATYHAHVCEEKGCGCVFPEERLLELHQTECHDPIAALRKERGEKIFACHLATCARVFGSPKTRRLHLIQVHGFPKEYFFAVTNKGVGGLLKKWGEGVSMVRSPWKARDGQDKDKDDEDDTEKEEEEDHAASEEHMEEAVVEMEMATAEVGETAGAVHDGAESHPERKQHWNDGPLVEEDDEDDIIGLDPDTSVDDLAASMDTLSLVPTAIRFGRGAKRGAVSHHSARGGRGVSHASYQPSHATKTETDYTASTRGEPGRGRGRGRRGRTPQPEGPGDVQPAAIPPAPPRGLGMGGYPGRGRILIHSAYGVRGRGYTMRGRGRGGF